MEEFSDMTDTERIDGIYKLSQSGLTDETKRDIMQEKNVVTNGKSKIEGGTVALITDNGAYIADTEISYPNMIGRIMMIVSTILACLIIPILDKIDKLSRRAHESLLMANLCYAAILSLLLAHVFVF